MHYRLWTKDTSEYNYKKLKKRWKPYAEMMHHDPEFIKRRGFAFVKAIYSAFQWPLILVLLISVLFSFMEFFKTWVMYYSLLNFKRMVNYEDSKDLYMDITVLVGGLAFSQLLIAVVGTSLNFYENLVSQRFIAAVRCLVFDKLLRKTFEREALLTFGEVTNIINNDTANLEDLSDMISGVFTLPLEVTVGNIMSIYRSHRFILPHGIRSLCCYWYSWNNNDDQLVSLKSLH